jgi:hypothetical protein
VVGLLVLLSDRAFDTTTIKLSARRLRRLRIDALRSLCFDGTDPRLGSTGSIFVPKVVSS